MGVGNQTFIKNTYESSQIQFVIKFFNFICIGFEERKHIWIVGSSIVKRAFNFSKSTFDGPQLSLNRHRYRIWWQGKGGMKWDELIPEIENMLKWHNPPELLVIHCGGNSIGQTSVLDLRDQIRSDLSQIQSMLPATRLIWSQILPRRAWRYNTDSKPLNLAAIRLNNFAASRCIEMGGEYIKYPELAWYEEDLFLEDKVHLSPIGNDMFLYWLQANLLYLTDFKANMHNGFM